MEKDNSTLIGFILSLLFLCIVFFFAYELPFLQHVLNLTGYTLLAVSLASISTYLMLSRIKKIEEVKERIVTISFIFVLNILFWISFPSLINRSNSPVIHSEISVDKVSLEWSSMFGMTADEKQNLKATHLRLQFDYNDQTYNRAFKKNKLRIERPSENELSIFLGTGRLGFDYILY